MRKKILYSTLAITSLFAMVSLYFSINHPVSIWKDDVKTWETITYNVFEFIGSTSDILHLITGLPTFIFIVLLFLTLWVILYIVFLLISLLFSEKTTKHENNLAV